MNQPQPALEIILLERIYGISNLKRRYRLIRKGRGAARVLGWVRSCTQQGHIHPRSKR